MKKIYVYHDEGVSNASFAHTVYSLSQVYKAPIHPVLATDLCKTDWVEKSALLVLPGGRDIPYMQKLKGLGNNNIQKFVESGGALLGICAGAYYCGKSIEFAANTPLEICQERALQFFPGIVRGPHFGSYDYYSLIDARAVKVFREKKAFCTAYYHGGGYFVDAHLAANTTIIATYDKQAQFPAIIECRAGKGKVLLSGVHLEYAPERLNPEHPHIKKIIPKLNRHNKKRQTLFKQIVDRLVT